MASCCWNFPSIERETLVLKDTSMPRRGFSLASILLLTAVIAVLLAALRSAGVASVAHDLEWLAPVVVWFGLATGGLLGVGVGAAQQRRLLGIPIGLVCGLIGGAVAGRLLVLPGTLAVLVIGSVLIVVFAAVVRFLSIYRGGS
jgi:hypothetical protein